MQGSLIACRSVFFTLATGHEGSMPVFFVPSFNKISSDCERALGLDLAMFAVYLR